MNMRILLGALGVIFLLAGAGRADAREDEQLWTTASATVKVSSKWRLSQEMTARFSANRDGLYELEAVTMIGRRIGKSITVAAGYVHNPQYSGGDFTVLEQRAREQVTFDKLARIGSGTLSGRLRLEQRWRDNAEGTAWRLRPYLKYSLPLRPGSKTSLTLSNETFVNLKSTSFQRTEGLDRMRNLVGINTPLLKNLSVEAGYLNQYGFVRDGEDNVDHAASFALSLSL